MFTFHNYATRRQPPVLKKARDAKVQKTCNSMEIKARGNGDALFKASKQDFRML